MNQNKLRLTFIFLMLFMLIWLFTPAIQH